MKKLEPQLGVGLGYRSELAGDLERYVEAVDFLEIVGDQCFEPAMCDQVASWAERLPTVCHFLAMSIGTAEPLDEAYLHRVGGVLERLRPAWFSDHLAVTRVRDVDLGHLTPVAFTEETVEIVSRKASEIQDRFGLPFLLENITYSFTPPGASLTEWELLTRVVEGADCGILLDLTNLHVNANNNDYDPYEYLGRIPLERVGQVHLGGAIFRDGMWVDSHAHPVPDPVFDLLEHLCERTTIAGVLLERDRNMPELADLVAELARARAILNAAGSGPGTEAG